MRQPFVSLLFVSGVVLLAAPRAFGDWQTDAINANRRALNQINDHHDAIINDIRARNAARPAVSGGRPLDTRSGAQIQREQAQWNRNWQQQVDAERADRDAWNAHLKAYNDRQYEIYLNNARIRAGNAALSAKIAAENAEFARKKLADKPAEYARFLKAYGGMGTQAVIPSFATQQEQFDWYSKQAAAGDTFAAFWLGRAMLAGDGAPKNPSEGAKWLQKADPKYPLTATFLGMLLVTGEWLPRDVARGRELLEYGAKNDVTGEGARLYGEILQAGIGVPKDEDLAAQQFFRARDNSYVRDIETLWIEYGWVEPSDIRYAREKKIAQLTRDRVRADPSRVAQWLSAWEGGKVGGDAHAFKMLMREIDHADEKSAPELTLQKLNYVEANNRSFDRGATLDRLIALGHPDAKARALLADGEYLWLSKEASDFWREGGAKIEAWAAANGPLQSRARAALLAHELGRFGDVAPPTPEQLLLKVTPRGWNDAPKLLASVGNRLNLRDVAGWTGGQARQWLEKLAALDAAYKPALAFYDAGVGLETNDGDLTKEAVRARFSDAKRDLQAGNETFSRGQIAAARLDFARAAAFQDSQPLAAFPLYIKALRGGDALAAWHLAAMQFPYFPGGEERQWLLDTLDTRLKRDVQGNDDMAATAAFALHLLHSEARGEQVYGRRIGRYWTLSKPDTTNWLQVAIEKRHPWAIHFFNSDAATKARNKYSVEDQKIWPWLATNFPVLSDKRDLWERDCRWLDMISPAGDIASLQTPLSALEKSTRDAARFREATARLPQTRLLLAIEPPQRTPQRAKQALMLYERALDAQSQDEYADVLLPFNRATRLERMIQATIAGHPVAPLQIVALLKEPQFPLTPNAAEVAQWLPIAKNRLIQSIKTGPIDEARENAVLLAAEFRSGEHFPKNQAEALKYRELAASLGDMSLASGLRGAYERGEMGAAKNAATARKWEKIFEAIAAGTYQIPPALLAGRAKS